MQLYTLKGITQNTPIAVQQISGQYDSKLGPENRILQ